jgi:magnesium-dependent phosphatase 1
MKYSLIVFDLDFTLWNAGGTWCDHTWPPYRKINNHVEDSENNTIMLYPEVQELIPELAEEYQLAVASRTHQPNWAIELLTLFGLRSFFSFLEIYPGTKVEHFHQLKKNSGIPFEEMIFFDDEMRNVDEVRRLNVDSILVDQGISDSLVKKHLL